MGKEGMVVGGRNLECCILSAAECGLSCTHADVAGKQEGKCWGISGRTEKAAFGETLFSPAPVLWFFGFFCFWSVLWRVHYH